MDGGLGPGELGVVVAPAGVGKSWLLCSLGAKAMLAGKNVAHFTLELNENYVGLRYDCCFTGINFQDIKHHQAEVEKKVKTINARLFVKYFPLKTVSAQSLKFHIERIQTLENFKIDVVVVDYADILRPLEKDKNSNSYSEMGGIYEELRQAAGELQIPVWTASQTNRTGLNEDVVQAHNVSDSYRKIMTADFVISLSRNVSDKANNTARFHVIKNRFGPDGITLYANMDTGNGNIQIYEGTSRESMAIQSAMDDGENDVKNMLKNKWNSHRQKENGENSDL
jgi:replicative DNA helicase